MYTESAVHFLRSHWLTGFICEILPAFMESSLNYTFVNDFTNKLYIIYFKNAEEQNKKSEATILLHWFPFIRKPIFRCFLHHFDLLTKNVFFTKTVTALYDQSEWTNSPVSDSATRGFSSPKSSLLQISVHTTTQVSFTITSLSFLLS